MKPTDRIGAFAALAACSGVGELFRQLRQLTRQIKLQHFADYTTRLQNIVLALPDDIDTAGFRLRQAYPKKFRL